MVGGLVQQENFCVHEDEPGQVHPGLFPAGEVGKELLSEAALQPQAGADLFQAHLRLIAAAGFEGGLKSVVTGQELPVPLGQLVGKAVNLRLHGLQLVEGRAQHILHPVPPWVHRDLGDQPQALPRRDAHAPAVCLLLPSEDTEEGGLSRAVAAQDAHPLPSVHLEAQAVQDRLAQLIFFCDVMYCDVDHGASFLCLA